MFQALQLPIDKICFTSDKAKLFDYNLSGFCISAKKLLENLCLYAFV